MSRRSRIWSNANPAWLMVAALPLLMGASNSPDELSETQLEEELLVGLFEGHGIPEPSDPAKAREARRIAQRLGQQCFTRGVTRGGGSEDYAGTCGITGDVPKEAAAALLDELDDPRVALAEGRSPGAWDRLLGALGSSGRTDVVPALITGLRRLELRKQAPGRLRDETHVWFQRTAIELALTELTHVQPHMTFGPKDHHEDPTSGLWADWLKEHGHETRDQWKTQAIERARQFASRADGGARYSGIQVLLSYRSSRAEGVRAALAMKRELPDYAQSLDELMKSAPRR